LLIIAIANVFLTVLMLNSGILSPWGL